MGRVIYDTATSVNGWIADEHGSLDWLLGIPHEPPDEGSVLAPPEAPVMVMGSTTYEWVLDAEDILAQPEKWRVLHGDRTTFVFSSRRLPVPAGAEVRLVSGPVAEAMPRIRSAADGADIWLVGGGDLAAQFWDAGALDEIRLSVAPAMLAGGAPLFPQRVSWQRLALVSASAEGPFARLVYRVR
ncbi:MAG: dihydrofolate reductase [Actinobacteria bacterium]|nr:MAG: dihydrofolate reductase [Actinomycetota bacterium]